MLNTNISLKCLHHVRFSRRTLQHGIYCNMAIWPVTAIWHVHCNAFSDTGPTLWFCSLGDNTNKNCPLELLVRSIDFYTPNEYVFKFLYHVGLSTKLQIGILHCKACAGKSTWAHIRSIFLQYFKWASLSYKLHWSSL